MNEIEFVQKLKEIKPNELNQIIQEGNRQFSKDYDHKRDYDRDLFYLVLFDKYITNNNIIFPEENYIYKSQLFPDLEVPMKVRYNILKQENNLVTVRKVCETILSDGLLKKIEENYDKYHKPRIKFKFSQYKLDVRNLFTYDIESKLLNKAEFTIIENIENNIKSECMYNLKRVNNLE